MPWITRSSEVPTLISYYGINPTIRYKHLTLTSVWAGVSGSKINNFALFELAGPNVVQQYNKMKAASEFYPKPSLAASNQHFRSSRYMEDGSFFRMSNIPDWIIASTWGTAKPSKT